MTSPSFTPPQTRLALIGTGIMGAAMGQHWLRAGYPLTVFNRTQSKAAALLESGATWADSPADAAREVDVLLLNVTDTPDVERVLFGDSDTAGAVTTLKPGAFVIDNSTISPDATRDFAMRLRERDITLLDAPVTGGDIGARNATLTIMVGADAADFEAARPLLECVGKSIVHVGSVGSGQALKACNQILCAINLIGVSEALMLAQRSGLDLEQAIGTLAHGAGGSWAWSELGKRVVAGDLQPAFMIKLMQKDLRIAQEAARAQHLPLFGTSLAQQLFHSVESHPGGSDLGTQAMIEAYRRLMPGA